MENDLLQAIEAQVEEWHIASQMSKERIKNLSPYHEGFRNGQIEALERVLSLIKLGEVNNEIYGI